MEAAASINPHRDAEMILRPMSLLGLCCVATTALAADGFKLPPEVTPSMRAACESDVRRLCIQEGSTMDSVKQCVLSKFMKLGKRCQMEIASAGLAP
jgi:hypothetical protein